MRSRRELWWCCGDDRLVVEGRCLGERERERERERREERDRETERDVARRRVDTKKKTIREGSKRIKR